MTLTADEIDNMRHALGINQHGKAYRNHFVTGEGSADYPIWMGLVAKGYATRRAGGPLSGGDDVFTVTAVGRAALANTDSKER